MKKRKWMIFVSLAVLAIFIVPAGIIVAAQMSDGSLRFFGRDRPPFMRVDNEQGNQELAMLNSYDDDKVFFDDSKRDFCLGYLKNFKDEQVTGNESEEEAERITRKNTLLGEYREYVDGLYNQVMTREEYDAHYKHLMDIFVNSLFPLEPEPTPEEQLARKINRRLTALEEELCYCRYGGGPAYIAERGVDVPELEQLIADFKALKEKILSQQLSYEQMQDEYAVCFQRIEKASPLVYAFLIEREAAESDETTE